MVFRLLADENTSHRLVSACRRLVPDFAIIHIAKWENGNWLGLDDVALLISCSEAKLVLVAFDRSTVAWHAGQLIRAGEEHAGIILFRGTVRSADYGHQSRLLTSFWETNGKSWDWQNRIVYLPKGPVPA
jgi:hypothetical protein